MSSYPTRNKKFQKNGKKKFKKLENTIMASVQAKIDWKKPRKRENKKKKIVLMSSYPPRNREFQKNSKKIQKIKEYHQLKYSKNYKTPSQLLSNPKQVRKCREREKIKIKNHSDVFLPDPEQKIPKMKQKNSKNLKTLSQLLFKPKQVRKCQEREKVKKNRSDELLPDP